MSRQSVVGVYNTFAGAAAAIRELDRCRFPIQPASIVLKYEDHPPGGKHLVVVHGSHQEVTWATDILRDTGPAELNVHTDPPSGQADPARLGPSLLAPEQTGLDSRQHEPSFTPKRT